MFGLFDYLKLGVGALLGAALMMPLSYHWGKAAERNEAAVKALENTVTILREREEIDDQISTSDAADLCGSMGLPDQERLECMRRLEAATPEPRDVGDDPQD